MWDDAIEAIKNSSLESSVYIGSDSRRFKEGKHPNHTWMARYSTVVILHMNSCNGGIIFHYSVTERDYGEIKVRLMREVSLAVEAASLIEPHLNGRSLEIHLDINPDPKYKSHVVVKETLGWVQGQGWDAKVKPDGWAASHAADHVVREKRMS